jgi:two-component system chemotaxis sensor kinase CheA
MSRKESDFLKRLLVTFQGEADERVRAVASGLVELENAPQAGTQDNVVELLFREVHSLKGAARSVNLGEIEAICQAMEDDFAALKSHKISPSLPLIDALHQATALLQELLSTLDAEPASRDRTRSMGLVRQLKELAKPAAHAAREAAPPVTPSPSLPPAEAERVQSPNVEEITEPAAGESGASSRDVQRDAPSEATPESPLHPPHEERAMPAPEMARETVRVATARLESLLLQVEELVSVKLAVGQRAAELREPTALLDAWDKRWAKLHPLIRTLSQSLEAHEKPSRVYSDYQNGNQDGRQNGTQTGEQNGKDALDADEWLRLKRQLTALLEFLEWNHTWVGQMDRYLTAISSASQRDQRAIGSMVDHLLQDMKQLLMLPVSSILEVFPSVTRDLARQQGNEVQLVIRGAEIEVDRRILQEIKDPLMHLVRNCLDHGIEMPEIRERRGKPRRGTITLTVTQRDSSKFDIVINDDGGGIDLVKVRNSAARLGLISSESAERMSDQEAKALIFQSGLSTSPLITDVSGRGLGLAIVQEKVEKLGGTITLETEPMQGSEFRLLLPLSLATLRGLLVRSEGHSLIVPILHVERVARLRRSEIQTVQNRETILLLGQTYSLVRLGQPLELPVKSGTEEPTEWLFVVILGAGEKRIAFWVDEIIGEQEVLMKGLGAQLARVRNIAGATVLGNGQVIPILNVPDLIKSAVRTMDSALDLVEASPAKDQKILIAEDSITARMQLKNILELNGYTVKTAVDGLDALMTLRTENFDLVVSDVDMPRLNGLDLTTRIRNDQRLAELPVILVTTLASREDQERGIDAGANAYITKSNFDQNKLLDAIRRLI